MNNTRNTISLGMNLFLLYIFLVLNNSLITPLLDNTKKYRAEMPNGVELNIEITFYEKNIYFKAEMIPQVGKYPKDIFSDFDDAPQGWYDPPTLFESLKEELISRRKFVTDEKIKEFIKGEGLDPDSILINRRPVYWEPPEHWFKISLLDRNDFELDCFYLNNPKKNNGYYRQKIEGKFPSMTWKNKYSGIEEWVFKKSDKIKSLKLVSL